MSKRTVPVNTSLQIDSAYYNRLDIPSFALMLKDPSFCYKFYWLEAIVGLISEGVTQTTFDAIIDEMICNAWYSVREFHIHLSGLGGDGQVLDGLERAILMLTDLSDLPANASKVEIRNEIRRFNKELKKPKEQLTNMVPCRALAGFFQSAGERVDWDSIRRLTAYIDAFSKTKAPLPYTLGTQSKLAKEVYFHPDWVRMIQENTVTILGWIQYEKVRWLQNNNPEVPFFSRFSDNQYILYRLIQEQPGIHKLHEGCWRDNMHSIWAGQELYRPGNSPETFKNILEKNMLPVYDAARRQGYEMWQMR